MAHLKKITENSPLEIKEGEFPIYICRCQLSKNLPYCDGSHQCIKDEEGPNALYVYEGDKRIKL
ncbi:MAG: CDGSH iron-sulfur domain-containing protein [Candidatus Acidulodesulfobacterium ferriphilum]|jgi:CDGSH-type Zn-finger protein|uniref:CDGSH iron-sulfur domain-containing protein n=1 Tax=Candidatus Acidulodesulfobacterium ferriphilum TaxID=2597223 RepID=A0A519BCQ5_9DELT|nr:MAG: CDGSH iron-sulfur domain-containing protein [Candidatus Acidulodesulfobacterium ferriphilum]